MARDEHTSLSVGGPDLLRRLKAQRPESDRLAAILEYLAMVPGCVAWRQNVGAMKIEGRFVKFGVDGLPDICGYVSRQRPVFGAGAIVAAQPLYLEVKREGGRRRPAQTAFVTMARAAGCIAAFVTCVADVQAELRAAGVRCP